MSEVRRLERVEGDEATLRGVDSPHVHPERVPWT